MFQENQKQTVIQITQKEKQKRRETPAFYAWLVIVGILVIGGVVIVRRYA